MSEFQGTVSGIDVIATPAQPTRCFAFVGELSNEIQVITENHALQTALELACAKEVTIEVSFLEQETHKELTRVRLLDR